MDIEFVKWLGHASFLIKAEGKNIYIDPFRLTTVREPADIILITHPHYDHLNMEDINKVARPQTAILVPKDSTTKVTSGRVSGVEPHSRYTVEGVVVDTIPAYNVNKERLDKHPKANGWVGYILNVNGMKIYHAGDTDFIEEMKKIKVDLALIPMSGTYTMDPEEAIEAAKHIDAKMIAPMHYKAVLGEKKANEAEEKFKKQIKNSVILKEVQEPYYSFG